MNEKIIEVKELKKHFKTKSGMLHAVDGVNFFINRGETLGLVGESGCGKSTTGRVLLRLIQANSGEVLFHNENILEYSKPDMKKMRKNMQIVFQDPYSCLNPRLTVSEIIAEPLIINKVYKTKDELETRIDELIGRVGLSERLKTSYPHELDGGRRQRVGIARALALNPEFLVLDEPVSALDVCIQAQILNLLKDLQKELGLTYLFIAHNLSVVKHISDRIAVMYLGQIIELTDYKSIFKDPLHPYTQALLSAIPIPKLGVQKERLILRGDVPSPINPAEGCRFAGRCDYSKQNCFEETPKLIESEPGRWVACHYVRQLEQN
ncbi:ABC transporter ATP-binding protein [Fusibacter sp. 3D3]|uniref:ABC transporter ATP-binding protein n=1 Tax=Fusibacter sp. 3D3 TaxID=1048380 RepID=UPI0008539A04|nr:oligopeptide/dipeptide ABC transporter ATP-binding protein [Fusibacter sp. 3D3]GAU78933.1 oligopeptide transport ATP-binding protein OppF [Fusibacter sp. 3D3]